MAGIGIKLNKIFEKNTIASHVAGAGYSVITTIAPMLLVMADILLMQVMLGYQDASYNEKQLFQSTILYVFIFSLLASSLLNAVISRYISDVIFEERYEDIMPCFYLGLCLNLMINAVMAVPFCIHEYRVGHVDIVYIAISFCCFIALSLVFYTMQYLSLCKDYAKISLFYFIGMAVSLGISCLFVYQLKMPVSYAMLSAMTIGFLLTASLGFALLKQYFTGYSHAYKKLLLYIIKYWKLVAANALYTLGLFIHNFVFWFSDLRIVVVDTFICAETYDLASCIAMFTNISASVIFIVLVEMQFNVRYKQYSEAVIGGRLLDIKRTQSRMFRQLSDLLMSITRIQFVISTVVFLVCLIGLQRFGYAGTVIQIYPCLAVGYFILFIMYAAFLFLYYFNDLNGAMFTGLIFCGVTLAGSIFSMKLDTLWYGLGLVIGAFSGWSYAFFKLRRLEKNINIHIFCNGTIIKQVKGRRPSGKVYPAVSAQSDTKRKAAKAAEKREA